MQRPAGVRQGKKEQHGELWGLVNLFKDNLERLETHQIIGEQRAPDEFRIEPVDFSSVERAPALAPTSWASVRRCCRLSLVWILESNSNTVSLAAR